MARSNFEKLRGYWLRRAFKRNLLTQEQIQQPRPMFDELAPRLNAYIKPIGARRARKSGPSDDNH